MDQHVSIRVRVPLALRAECAGASEVGVRAGSVRGALVELERLHPGFARNVCDETGVVRQHVNVFVNQEHVRELAGLETELREGDVLTILPAVSGGAA